jgi:hypothetical protein
LDPESGASTNFIDGLPGGTIKGGLSPETKVSLEAINECLEGTSE